MVKKLIAIVAIVVILLAAVGAFTFTGNDRGHEEKEQTDEYYANGIVVNDRIPSSKTDNILTFKSKPTRIFVCFAANVELLCSLGLEDYIVGAYVRTTDAIPLNEQYTDSYAKALNKSTTKVGAIATWSKEYIQKCNPDLIIAWSGVLTDSRIGTIDFWKQYDVKCIRTNQYGNGSGSSLDTYYQMLGMMGKIWNVNEKTDAKILELKEKQKAIAEKTKNIPDSKKPRVLVMDYDPSAAGENLVYGTDMLTGQLIEAAGGICVSKDRMEDMTFEQIAKSGADFIFLVGYLSAYTHISDDEIDKMADWVLSIPVFKAMGIPKDRITALPFYTMYMAGVLDEDVLDQMYSAMYPGQS